MFLAPSYLPPRNYLPTLLSAVQRVHAGTDNTWAVLRVVASFFKASVGGVM